MKRKLPNGVIGLASALTTAVLLSAFAVVARSQEPSPQQPAPSVVDAANRARDRQANLPKATRVITNDDLGPLLPTTDLIQAPPAGPTEVSPLGVTSSPVVAAASANSADSTCTSPDADALKIELQETQDQRDHVQSELTAQPEVISGGNLDAPNFIPGNSGLSVGSKPLQESQPEDPARVTEVTLDEKIASLKKNLQLACASTEAAPLLKQLDSVEQQLSWAQRQLSLDQNAFYSNPDSTHDTAGQARLDAEQQQVEALQSERDRLKDALSATSARQSPASL
jgi:hypothetical protein